jgi:CRISPR-associated protein Cmr2
MPIFAGGDDVLAVLPLHRALEAMRKVHELFDETAQAGAEPFTLSAGVAIFHALDALDEAIQAARHAEKTAKKVDGKNAVCIVVQHRSGAPVSAVDKWDRMLELLDRIDRAYRADQLSFGFAHELAGLLARVAADDELDDVLPDLARAIAERKTKEDSMAPELVQAACGRAGGDYREALTHLLNCMLVTRRISRAEEAAYGKPAVIGREQTP